MLEQICLEIRNFFLVERVHGTYTIQSGILSPLPDGIKQGNYFRIVGSASHDGVYMRQADSGALLPKQAGSDDDETFSGSIWVMRVPPSFIALAGEIKKFRESDAAKPGAYASESFGGYTYTRATGKNGGALTWQEAFRSDLNAYRRARIL